MSKATHTEHFYATAEAWRACIAKARGSKHPTHKGNIAEEAWRGLFEDYLPSRYRVGSGFVIGACGSQSKQIDCIVYDSLYTPTLFNAGGMLYIPAESVHAVFEIKQRVEKRNIVQAADKIASVRTISRTSAPYVGDGEARPPKEHFPIIGGLLARERRGQWDAIREYIDSSRNRYPDDRDSSTSGSQESMGEKKAYSIGHPSALDIVLTSESGYISYFRGYLSDPHIESGDMALMRGVWQLVRALQQQGTVPAIDMLKWLGSITESAEDAGGK